MSNLKPISQKQAIITISDISDVQWRSVSGGKVTRERIKYDDHKTGLEQTFVGFSSLEELTVVKNFDPTADAKVFNWAIGQNAKPTIFNVAIQPVKTDLLATPFEGSKQILYSNCTLAEYLFPNWDRESSGLAVVTLTIIFNTPPTYQ
jgi:hypothetical protein